MDYFTSYYYATGEMMSALHPYGLQKYGYIAVTVIAFANFVFGILYMYSLGPFNEGGGSYTASMRYLKPTLSLIVAVTLIQDYVLTIVVSALSGGDQLLSIINAYDAHWIWHFAIGAALAAITWFLTIRGRGESSRVVFTMLGVFLFLTLTMGIGLAIAHFKGVTPQPAETAESVSLAQAFLHMLTASMKGMVALTGLEAVSNGVQFFINEDVALVKWGKKHMPRWKKLWDFYSGKSGIGRFVQTSFLFYGGNHPFPDLLFACGSMFSMEHLVEH
ncbi:amino acid permease [Candidatus Villigracilis affinis]|uniref:amino acid permease n=1 Tax=Candidatus Villigracilis affinis TaxID=3140682 RepID=UPI002A203489|nr:amino acid permease [Anaerolineales bacterium]